MSKSSHNKLHLLGGLGCGGGSCPAIYKDDNGRIFVQGSKIDHELRSQVAVPEHEELVELPRELLNILKDYRG